MLDIMQIKTFVATPCSCNTHYFAAFIDGGVETHCQGLGCGYPELAVELANVACER